MKFLLLVILLISLSKASFAYANADDTTKWIYIYNDTIEGSLYYYAPGRVESYSTYTSVPVKQVPYKTIYSEGKEVDHYIHFMNFYCGKDYFNIVAHYLTFKDGSKEEAKLHAKDIIIKEEEPVYLFYRLLCR